MEFEEALLFVQKKVNARLSAFFREKRIEACLLHPSLCELIDVIADFTLRSGKRIRPCFCFLGYASSAKRDIESVLKKTPEYVLRTATAFELFHTFALIHDEIIDEDLNYHEGPAVHEHFRLKSLKKMRKGGYGAKYFGISMGILAGDLVFSWANDMMEKLNGKYKILNIPAKGGSSSGEKNQLSRIVDSAMLYQRMKESVVYGQALDVFKQNSYCTGILKERTHELKTAWYSVIYPLQIGAALAGAKVKELENFNAYGLSTGLLFQLRDDYLDNDIDESDWLKKSGALMQKARKASLSISKDKNMRQIFKDIVKYVAERNR